jgi:hypothetical protein
MTKDDVLKGARGKPTPFKLQRADGQVFECLLRPMTYGERRELFDFSRDHGNEPGSGMELQARVVTLTVCDESGKPLLEPADLGGFDVEVIEAIAAEVARRNGVDGRKAGEPGKGESPTTPS